MEKNRNSVVKKDLNKKEVREALHGDIISNELSNHRGRGRTSAEKRAAYAKYNKLKKKVVELEKTNTRHLILFPASDVDVKVIEKFLARLGLILHPHKRSVQSASRGVDFLGGVVYPGLVYPGKRLIQNANKAFHETVAGVRDVESVVSYLGHMKYFSATNVLTELFEKVGWEYLV